VSGGAARARGAWAALDSEQRQAGLAALGLVVALFLPWYQKSVFRPAGGGRLESGSESLNAFEVISWVEAAVVLVAAGVLWLLWARAQRRGFHLPGGDGAVVLAAGAWAALLLVWRLFDKPDVAGAGATVGIQWGWFVALVMAGLVAAAGARIRAAHLPEPPNPAEDLTWEGPAPRASRGERGGVRPREPVPHTAVTEVLGERPPGWEGEPPEAPSPRRRPPGDGESAGEPPSGDRRF
jgi:hypothetical protein